MNCFNKQEPCKYGHTIGRDARGRCIQCNRDGNKRRDREKRARETQMARWYDRTKRADA